MFIEFSLKVIDFDSDFLYHKKRYILTNLTIATKLDMVPDYKTVFLLLHLEGSHPYQCLNFVLSFNKSLFKNIKVLYSIIIHDHFPDLRSHKRNLGVGTDFLYVQSYFRPEKIYMRISTDYIKIHG